MKTVCLNMIVKDESAVIQRCLEQMQGKIDYWVIVDTGSTDGTQALVRELFREIPGELHERAWVNFEQNRNEALDLARGKGDYILFIDADEKLVFPQGFSGWELDKDSYCIKCAGGIVEFCRTSLINSHPAWRWEGVMHEVIVNPHQGVGDVLPGFLIETYADGARAKDPKIHLRDAKILEKELKKDPMNKRNVYYLAQSYLSAGEQALALKHYQKRADMGGMAQEVFWSLFMVGLLQHELGKESSVVLESYCKAIHFDPSRVEPIYNLAVYLTESGQFFQAYLVAKHGASLVEKVCLHLQIQYIWDYAMLMRFAELSLRIGKKEESLRAYQRLLAKNELPQEVRVKIEATCQSLF